VRGRGKIYVNKPITTIGDINETNYFIAKEHLLFHSLTANPTVQK